ncbi:NAD(P)-binding Rossmann-fold containing protein [Glarea lozoyensis ATCC 20868]|uniref:NAD(P)-binding Rossmann-fold containing protein n=1 Tax=Glarea lozoyensis (strain ATCC 20868 / MF5171) TaxID=1116229 RepID=S3CG33_GLAL2|nr:NAD(P)-binding Rossmann-fold containing protein [Glarea lozoyensis ATCC 20868]EPE24219.1 NAD(P)-binding Rossmann-fold containing protein [Glarea lozoyensis ATCC 20868]
MGQSPSALTLTEKNLPDQTGKVFLITGSTSGVGLELAQILYSRNAKVYIAARNAEKAARTIETIESKHPSSAGELVYLHLDLSDLTTINSSAQEFLDREKRLDVLWNNAGVMVPPQGSTTKQGYEMQIGTNNVAPFLFTKLLTPLLIETAKTASPGSVRVVWVSSSAAARFSPEGGVEMDNLGYEREDKSAWFKYGVSKAGNILHASEYARRVGEKGVLSLSLDPGNLKTDLYNQVPRWQMLVVNLVLKEPIYGAYTELYGGLSEDIKMENNGTFAVPWGKMQTPRADIALSCKSKDQGGTGLASQFWEWSEKQVENYI